MTRAPSPVLDDSRAIVRESLAPAGTTQPRLDRIERQLRTLLAEDAAGAP